ncbi:RNA polymerase sigma factor [Spiribacter halobius]|uniref:RNA polymerase sigma factor n=1 Tax=Sediminicurvatus halobius TaxID=2182432 RepID=UPI001304E5A8|nr:RNA polymerase sigma factor [Spiribacter halobius]UEX77852.1 RNA polymerase sigma factor [Spiribacter halobius]
MTGRLGRLPLTPGSGEEAPDEDAALLAALQDGDDAARRQAIEDLYFAYAGRFQDYYRRHGASSAEAADWTQDTFIQVLRRADTVRDHRRLRAWLWTTARHVMIDAIRRRRGTFALSDEVAERLVDPDAPPLEQIQRDEHQDCLRREFERFAEAFPDRAQCLIWAAVDGLSMVEIGDLLSRTPGATREYLSQCRKKLRPFLERCQESEP